MISCWSDGWFSHVSPPVATAGLCATLWLFEAQVPTITWPKATFKKWQYRMTRAIEKKCLKIYYLNDIPIWLPSNILNLLIPAMSQSKSSPGELESTATSLGGWLVWAIFPNGRTFQADVLVEISHIHTYITLHYITSHHITSHHITSHHIHTYIILHTHVATLLRCIHYITTLYACCMHTQTHTYVRTYLLRCIHYITTLYACCMHT